MTEKEITSSFHSPEKTHTHAEKKTETKTKISKISNIIHRSLNLIKMTNSRYHFSNENKKYPQKTSATEKVNNIRNSYGWGISKMTMSSPEI